MIEKKELLVSMSERMSIDVSGLERYTTGEPSIIVANHTCMRDIFSVSSGLPEASEIVLSARLMWKSNTPENKLRREVIEKSLYGIPLEVHGGDMRLRAGFDMARRALTKGHSVIIFPEGAYTGASEVTKGRTGASRILFDAVKDGARPNLVPIGIDQSPVEDIDSFTDFSGHTRLVIGEPIAYEEAYTQFVAADSLEERKSALRAPIDLAMRAIAAQIDKPYVDEYIPIWPRSTVVIESGEEIPIEESQASIA
jgi:1-acyl-sn-glycerol-3-phosphate acyltransferase